MLIHADDDLVDVDLADNVSCSLLLNGLKVRVDARVLRSLLFLRHSLRHGNFILRVPFAHLAYFGHLFERRDLEGLANLVQFDLSSLDHDLCIIIHFSSSMLILRQIELRVRLGSLS